MDRDPEAGSDVDRPGIDVDSLQGPAGLCVVLKQLEVGRFAASEIENPCVGWGARTVTQQPVRLQPGPHPVNQAVALPEKSSG